MQFAIDVCAGAGGLSLGLQRAGWEVLGVDNDSDAAATHRAMVGPCERADIMEWHPPGPAELVCGGLPCQGWSVVGRRGALRDPRSLLFHELLRIAREASARAILMENVRGLISLGGLHVIQQAFATAGYEPKCTLLNAADFGVPQNRIRLFIVGFRKPADLAQWRWPAPTHGPVNNVLGLPRWRTVRDALAVPGGYRMERIDGASRWNGRRTLDIDADSELASAMAVLDSPSPCIVATEDRSERPRENAQRRRASETIVPALSVAGPLDRPSTTIAATDRLSAAGHHEHDKQGAVRLTIEQCAALQGFPPEFVFSGKTKASRYRQCGNAVPPPLAEAIGKSLITALRAHEDLVRDRERTVNLRANRLLRKAECDGHGSTEPGAEA